MALSAAELACMKAAQADLMPDSATVERPNLVSDGRGGHVEGSPTETVVACRVSIPTQAEREMWSGAKGESEVGYVVVVPLGTDVRGQDRIVVGTRTFEVKGTGSGSYSSALRCFCVEVV